MITYHSGATEALPSGVHYWAATGGKNDAETTATTAN